MPAKWARDGQKCTSRLDRICRLHVGSHVISTALAISQLGAWETPSPRYWPGCGANIRPVIEASFCFSSSAER